MIESIQSISTQGIVREYMPTAYWALVWNAMTQYGKELSPEDEKIYGDAMSRLHSIIPFDRIEREEINELAPGLTD
tara:strand:+ start:228 stop:455 length:228 start_codon:yes stop_codon:yes gene_type:complete